MQRSERIQRNALKLQQLAVQQRLTDLNRPSKPRQGIHKSRVKQESAKKPVAQKQPVRSSARVRGVAVDGAQPSSSSDAADAPVSDEANTSEIASAGPLAYQIICELHCLLQLFCLNTMPLCQTRT